MRSPHLAHMGSARPPASSSRLTDHPTNYCPIPQRLLADLHDTPLAIGLYALVGRLYLVHQAPVPLSRADVLRYDPTLKAGAVKRAFDRLVEGGWLVEAIQEGRKKQRYTPTWGRVKGAPLPWRMDQPCLGRPRHIARLPIDRGLLDICMGKLTPHATRTAVITRYMTVPALSLADVGSYALTLAELPHETPNLRWLGLVRNGRALPVPAEHHLLAIISQRPLTLDDAPAGGCDMELTISGTRRLGLAPLPPSEETAGRAQPLFFVPPGLIGPSIGPLIGSLIGHVAEATDAPTAPASDEIRSAVRPAGITWESRDPRDIAIPPQPPPTPCEQAEEGGGAKRIDDQDRGGSRRAIGPRQPQAAPEIPDTEATQLLKAINVRPERQIELAELPTATIEAAIADGRARDGIRDLAGWVVSLLRAHRDYGWKIAPPTPRPDSPEALAAAFARYAADQEAARHADMPSDQPWFPPLAPTPLNVPCALIRLWNNVHAASKAQVPRREFDAWIRRLSLLGVERGVATVMAPNTLAKTAIEDRYLGMLRDLLTIFAGEPLEVRVILNPSAPAEASGVPAANAPAQAEADTPTTDGCPAWIAAERWPTLPVTLRAALAGSELIDGTVRGRSMHLSWLLRTRYACEVGELLSMDTNMHSIKRS